MPSASPWVHGPRVLTPARDFWMFSLALAMSRRITLAPFSCRQCRKNQVFSFIKKISKKGPSRGESKKVLHRLKLSRTARSGRCRSLVAVKTGPEMQPVYRPR